MSMLGIDVTKKPKKTAAAKAGAAKASAEKSFGGKTGFTAGKSLIAEAVETQAEEQESFIWKLCPLHWDDNTTRLLIAVAASAWMSGIFVGWQLHKQLMT